MEKKEELVAKNRSCHTRNEDLDDEEKTISVTEWEDLVEKMVKITTEESQRKHCFFPPPSSNFDLKKENLGSFYYICLFNKCIPRNCTTFTV